MKRMVSAFILATAVAAGGAAVSAQLSIPEIPFDSNADLLRFPDNVHMGEAAGVATNSRGDIFLYTRTGNPFITIAGSRFVSHGGSRLFQFDRTGKFVREIGQGAYGFLQAQQVRVDRQDNVWVVDQMSTQVIKFDTNGRIAMIFSRKPEAMRIPALPLDPLPTGIPIVQAVPEPPAAGGRGGAPAGPPAAGRGGPPAGVGAPPPGGAGAPPPAAPGGGGGRGGRGGGLPGAGAEGEQFNRPTDVAWDSKGNIYVADGYGNARIAKYEPTGKWIKNWGSRGSAPGQFNIVHGIAVDAQDNVYVADEGNRRIQVFDSNGTFKTQFLNVGTPTAICITPGPRQVLYVAHTGDPDGMEDAAIYKVSLEGRILGKFGRAGKLPKEFGLVNSIDCRSETELLVGELSNWRVQRLTLRASQ
jgi:DNA-binding beta-propeller fold protein YncE